MALPEFSMRRLLEAGVHFGHHTRRWNPKMAPYIFGVRNGVHIIDLEQTMPLLERALAAIRDVVAGGGRVLFVGTKRQAADMVAEAGARSGQYYVNHRWLGGMLTNWNTISKSIKRLRELDALLVDEESTQLTKKELLRLTRERNKLERALGGIKEMGDLPNILFVIDTNKEAIAVAEAKKLGIPIVGVIDSNSEPDGITYPVPGNDDAMRAISLYCDLVADAVLDGLQAELRASGVDVGAAQQAPKEALPAPGAAAAEAPVEAAPAEKAPEPTTAEPAAEAAAKVAPEPAAAEPAAEAAPSEAAPSEAALAEAAPSEAAPSEAAPSEAAPSEAALAEAAPEPAAVEPAAEVAAAEAVPEPAAAAVATAEAAPVEAAPEPVAEPAAEESPAEAAPEPAVAESEAAAAEAEAPAKKPRQAAKKPATAKKPPAEKGRTAAKKRPAEKESSAAEADDAGKAGAKGSRRAPKA